MKNKKLFAILTLVCFMFTLMPVAAFAGDATQVTIGGKEDAEATTGVAFTAAVDANDTVYAYYAVDEDGEGYAVSLDGNFTIKDAGEYKIFAIDVTSTTSSLYKYLEGVGYASDKVDMLESEYDAKIVDGYATVDVKAPNMEYKIVFMQGNNVITKLEINANNGFNAGETDNVVAVLQKSVKGQNNWSGLKGQDIALNVVGYADAAFVKGATTDKAGKVEFEVTSGTAGNYQVIAKWGKTSATLPVEVKASNAVNVVVNAEPAAPVNVNAQDNVAAAAVEFKFTDNSGAAASATVGGNVELSVVEQPADSKLKAADFDLVAKQGVAGVYTLVAKNNAQFEEGTYKIKVSLANGSSATATVKVAEQGDVVGIKFVKAPTTVAYTAKNFPVLGQEGMVVTVDANGVTEKITADLSVSGKAVAAFADNKLTLTVDEDFIGSTVTVYAIYKSGNETFTASNALKVIDSAASIAYTAKTAEVGVTTTLYAHVVDATGNVVALQSVTPQIIVLEKPENAVVVATPGAYAAKTGLPVSFLASAAGEYTIQTIVTYNDGAADRYISSIDTITVGAKAGASTMKDVVVISIGADKMIVGDKVVALDVAPYIEAGRTMLQFNVLDAFGITVTWDEANRAVVAEGNGIKVVLTIDSKVAVVNGEVVTLDVAPQIVNGRTVVPVGFITGTFGINPTFTYNADGTIADILFAK